MSAVDEKTFKKAISTMDDKIYDLEDSVVKKLKNLKQSLQTGKDVELEQIVQNLQTEIKKNNKSLFNAQEGLQNEIADLKVKLENMQKSFKGTERGSVKRSLTKSSIKLLSPKKGTASVRNSTIEDQKDLSPDPRAITEIEEEFKGSIEMALSEEDEGEMFDENNEDYSPFQKQQSKSQNTKSSKVVSWNTQKITDKIEHFVGDDLSRLKHQMNEIVRMIDSLKFQTLENSQEIEINRKKLFAFMRSEKSNLDTQDRLALSIQKGIKQAKDSARHTTKDLTNSFVSKIVSPREPSPDNTGMQDRTFLQSTHSKAVSIL